MDTNRPDFLDPSFEVHLTKIGVLKDGVPDREWFLASCAQSKVAIEFAKAEMERELRAIANGEEY